MADYTTEMDCIRTFLLAVHTDATTKHFTEQRNIEDIVDASGQKMLVRIGEIISRDGDFYWKRYKVQISETGEATLTTAINNIIIGIEKFNRRASIDGFTYASAPTMCHMKFAYGNIAWEDPVNKRWACDIFIDVEWSTQ